MKYTIAVRAENRNAPIKVFFKMRGAGEYGNVEIPEESFLLSLLWFPRGFVDGTVASAPMSLGFGGLGRLTVSCFPPPSMEARTPGSPT